MDHLQEVLKSVNTSRSRNTSFSSVLTLASWRLRRSWLLLLMVMFGMIAAVSVACAAPLFFPITTTAGLRGMLREQSTNSQINCDIDPLGLSSQVVQTIQQQITPIFQQNIGSYMSSRPQFTINSSNIDSLSPHVFGEHYFHVISTLMKDAAPHITLVQGRLPHLTSTPGSDIEILMTPNTAAGLHLHVGSVMVLSFPFYTQLSEPLAFPSVNPNTTRFRAHIVGLFTVNSRNLTYWQGRDFEPYTVKIAVGKEIIFHYSLLLPIEGLLGIYDGLAAKYHIKTPLAVSSNTLTWTYALNPARFTSAQLNTAIDHMANLKSSFDVHFVGVQSFHSYLYDPNNPPPFPYIVKVVLSGPFISIPGTPSNLELYRSRVAITGIPTMLISVQIIGLILFFVSLMTNVLVEYQADTIAILYSRGASRGQIFGALLTQSIVLGIIAVIVGVPLALLVVLFITQHILPPATRDALDVVSTHLVSSALGTLGYAALIVLVMLFTMSFSLGHTARMDVLSIRRNASRITRLPLWQHFHLDIIVGIIALVGSIILLYLSRVGTQLSGTMQAVVVVPLALIAPLFLVIGCLLLSLRLLPLFLQWGASIAGRGRSATSMLALAQMARLPQQAIRMVLLLALAIGFTLFGLIFSASQKQHINDLAAYQVGSDFSGNIPTNAPQLSRQEWTKFYQTMPGVTSASVGYTSNAVVIGGQSQLQLFIQAVDTSTFPNTAIWPQGTSSQPLASLMTLLATKQDYGESHGLVPVIIDSEVSNTLALHVGSTFHASVSDNALLINDLSCVVVGMVQHIPTPSALQTSDEIPTGGLLMDYQTYNLIYTQTAQNLVGKVHATILPNHIWLRTRDDALAQTRASLNREDFYLDNLQDRRALIDQQYADPLSITLIGMLNLGMVVTLLLAILGDMLVSWLSTRTRLINFSVLRALGTSPRQLASVLGWEQVLVYGIGLLLGIAFGMLLANTVVPTLLAHNITGAGTIPIYTVIPSTLLVAMVCIILLFVAVLGMMIYIVSKPSMSQTLRLNED